MAAAVGLASARHGFRRQAHTTTLHVHTSLTGVNKQKTAAALFARGHAVERTVIRGHAFALSRRCRGFVCALSALNPRMCVGRLSQTGVETAIAATGPLLELFPPEFLRLKALEALSNFPAA